MALGNNELFSGVTRGPSLRMASEHSAPKTMAATVGAPFLKTGTPVYFDSMASLWKVWTNGQIVDGFVDFQTALLGSTVVTPNVDPASGTVAEGIQLSASVDVHAVIMLRGRIHYDDIVLPAGEMAANLQAALRDGLIKAGLIVQGLTSTT